MLSQHFKYWSTIDHHNNIEQHVRELSTGIKDAQERDILLTYIFHKTEKHRVKYISYDYDTTSPLSNAKDLQVVINALIKLSSIKFVLRTIFLREQASHFIVGYIKYLYTYLQSGLLLLKDPEEYCMATTYINRDIVIEIANMINASFIRSLESRT